MRMLANEKRTLKQLKEHYEIEKELAKRLRNASKAERRYLYVSLYDELYRRVPHHPQLARKTDSQARLQAVSRQMRLLKHFLNPESIFLEMGPGDCSLSLELAKFVSKVYGIDVSKEITEISRTPKNFQLLISDGCSIPILEKSIDVTYSYQVMEHLHPDDAQEQIRSIYRALAPGGIYICITPNLLAGPHDISKYFDEVATGFHLREYTTTELTDIFKAAGFSKVKVCIGAKGYFLLLPGFSVRWVEYVLIRLPRSLRRKIADWSPVRLLLGITLVATK